VFISFDELLGYALSPNDYLQSVQGFSGKAYPPGFDRMDPQGVLSGVHCRLSTMSRWFLPPGRAGAV